MVGRHFVKIVDFDEIGGGEEVGEFQGRGGSDYRDKLCNRHT